MKRKKECGQNVPDGESRYRKGDRELKRESNVMCLCQRERETDRQTETVESMSQNQNSEMRTCNYALLKQEGKEKQANGHGKCRGRQLDSV